MTRQRFLAKQQCVENVIVVDALDVTRNRTVSLECACSAEIFYCTVQRHEQRCCWNGAEEKINIIILLLLEAHCESHLARMLSSRAGIVFFLPILGRAIVLTTPLRCWRIADTWGRSSMVPYDMSVANNTRISENRYINILNNWTIGQHTQMCQFSAAIGRHYFLIV